MFDFKSDEFLCRLGALYSLLFLELHLNDNKEAKALLENEHELNITGYADYAFHMA